MTYLIFGGIFLVLALALFFSGYVSAKPNEVMIITGMGNKRFLIGKAGWKIPVLEQTSKISIEQFSVDVTTTNPVPTKDFINVNADAVVKAKIATKDILDKDGNVLYSKDELLEAAAQNFLNHDTKWISDQIQDVLEGNLREIIGQMELKDMVSNRQQFSENVFINAQPDLAKMGLEIIAFTVQNFSDDEKAIKNLGIDNLTKIQKEASNAKALAEREIAEVAAEQNILAAEAKAKAAQIIAQKENDVRIEQARLKALSDKQQAQADAVREIEEQNQRKEIERQTAEANIVRQEKEAEVAKVEAQVKEERLNASIRKQAEAEKYAREQAAEAEAFERIKQAEAELSERQARANADLYETQKEAEAREAKAKADLVAAKSEAEGISAKGQAEAAAIKAKLEAEAKGLREKAEAMKLMDEAAKLEMIVNVLPKIAEALAAPLNNIDNMTVYGSDGGSKLIGDMMQSMDQVSKGMGLDIPNMLNAAITGNAIGRGISNTNNKEIIETT